MSFLDFAQLRRPKSPNTSLLAPQDYTPKARVDRPSPVFEADPDTLFAKLEAYVRSVKAFRSIEADAGERALKWVAVTPLLRFKDDVDVRVLPAPGDVTKSVVAIYSRSRVGRSDLGTNGRRIDAILAAIS
jgi:uncharacterized protein (DUF1499 family)